MKKLLSILTVSLAFLSCQKEETCQLNSTGTLKAVSIEIEPFYTWVNGEYIGIADAATITKFDNIPSGQSEVQFYNVNDGSEVYTSNITITSCQESAVQF